MKKTPAKKVIAKALPKKHGSKLGRFILFLLVIGGVAIIGLAIFFIYSRILPQSDLAEHLPADQTVAVVEWEDMTLPAKLQAKVKDETVMTFVKTLLDFDLKPAVNAFGTGKVAYVLLDVQGEQNKPVLLIQAHSKTEALAYFKTLKLEGEDLDKEDAIYTFTQGQPYSFKFLDRYVAISTDRKVLEGLEDNPKIPLSNDEAYLKTITSLPRNKWISGYANVEKLSLTGNPAIENVIEPLKYAANNFAFTVQKETDGLKFNTFLNVKKDLLSLESQNKAQKFTQSLIKNLPAKAAGVYFGGSNLAEEWENTLQSISNLNPSYGIILEGLLRAQTNKLFGSNVDLQNDLYPLFEGEYAFEMGQGKNGKQVVLLLAHDDEKFAQKKMEKMAKGFESIAARLEPKISVVALPDGTESRELVPDASKVNSSTDTMDGHEVHCTEVGQTGFCYTVTESEVIMTSGKDLLKTVLAGGEDTLANDSSFEKVTANLSHSPDEITFVNFDQLSGLLAGNPYFAMLEPVTTFFDSAAWVKQYFEDGASSEGYVLFK